MGTYIVCEYAKVQSAGWHRLWSALSLLSWEEMFYLVEAMNMLFGLKEAHVYGGTNSRSVQAIFGT